MGKDDDKEKKGGLILGRIYGAKDMGKKDDGNKYDIESNLLKEYFNEPSSNVNITDGTNYTRYVNDGGSASKSSANHADGMRAVRGEDGRCATHDKVIAYDKECADCYKSNGSSYEAGHGSGYAEDETAKHKEEARDALLSIYKAMALAGLGGVGTGVKIMGKAVSVGLALEGLLTVKDFKDEYDKHLKEVGSSEAARKALKKVGEDILAEKTVGYILGRLGFNSVQSSIKASIMSDIAKERKPRGDVYNTDRHIKDIEGHMAAES